MKLLFLCLNEKKTHNPINLAEALIHEFITLRDRDKLAKILIGGMITFFAHTLCPSESLDYLCYVDNDTLLNIPLLQTYHMVNVTRGDQFIKFLIDPIATCPMYQKPIFCGR